ncbi:hypothetical protein Y10_04880 [Neptunitalea sp. Y10]|uniref:Uncharacterized protein n=2 Tax=Neptunitalea lumnitzerae TaxID=2965509 RepID=A0ABQ5MFD4_9FLAO|nr:hypothetical protein Y10_04880 [Neptunitalea sp. Y10]
MGIGAFYGIKKVSPDMDPFISVNNVLVYWVLVDLVLRFFMQQLPVLDIKPLLILPIKKRISVNFLLAKGLFSFFNVLPLFFYVPFTIVLLINGYDVSGTLLWFVAMLLITCSTNFVNFLINKNNTYFALILGVLATFVLLAYFRVFDVSPYVGSFLYGIYTTYYYALIPLLLFGLFYYLNYKYLMANFYLDGAISKKVKEVQSTDLSFLNRFGAMAPFLKNDLKMIWRNKRPKQVVFFSLFFVGYGLFFFTNSVYEEQYWIKPFVGMFITGGFLMTFGQNVPSWDSEYYKLMMSQNIKYRTYLESKWLLMVVATAIAMLLSLPYIYFGKEILLIVLGAGLFNMGLNAFVVLLGGVFNKTPIKLNDKAKAFSNTQAFSATMLIIALPKMLLPIIIFYIPYVISGSVNIGVVSLGVAGLLGVIFRNQIFKFIEKMYQKEKYKTIAAYNTKN